MKSRMQVLVALPRRARDGWVRPNSGVTLIPDHPTALHTVAEREFLIDNLLVRIHFIIVMIGWTGLAPWEFELPFSGSLTSTFSHGSILRKAGIVITPESGHLLLLAARYGSNGDGSDCPTIPDQQRTTCNTLPSLTRETAGA